MRQGLGRIKDRTMKVGRVKSAKEAESGSGMVRVMRGQTGGLTKGRQLSGREKRVDEVSVITVNCREGGAVTEEKRNNNN